MFRIMKRITPRSDLNMVAEPGREAGEDATASGKEDLPFVKLYGLATEKSFRKFGN